MDLRKILNNCWNKSLSNLHLMKDPFLLWPITVPLKIGSMKNIIRINNRNRITMKISLSGNSWKEAHDNTYQVLKIESLPLNHLNKVRIKSYRILWTIVDLVMRKIEIKLPQKETYLKTEYSVKEILQIMINQ